MRRLLPLLILAGIFAWLWQQGTGGSRLLPGLSGGISASRDEIGSQPPDAQVPAAAPGTDTALGHAAGATASGPGTRDELRIRIRDDAKTAEHRHRELIARFGDDPVAVRWVKDCLAEQGLKDVAAVADRDWQYACWEAYAQLQLPGDSGQSVP